MSEETFQFPLDGNEPSLVNQEERYLAKYGNDHIQCVQLQPNESLQSYIDRLCIVYPEKYQQSYIRGAQQVLIAGAIGGIAYSHFQRGEPIPEPMSEHFHPANIEEAMERKPDGSKFLVVMNRDKAAEVIAACNLASFHVSEFQELVVHKVRDQALAVIHGTTEVGKIPLIDRIKVTAANLKLKFALNLTGEELFNELIKKEVEREITPESLHLPTRLTVQDFKTVADEVSKTPYEWIEVVASNMGILAGMDFCGIYPHVYQEIEKAVDHEFGITDLLPGTQ